MSEAERQQRKAEILGETNELLAKFAKIKAAEARLPEHLHSKCKEAAQKLGYDLFPTAWKKVATKYNDVYGPNLVARLGK